MKTFIKFLGEIYSHKDLNVKYRGISNSQLRKMVNDDRKYTPQQRKDIQTEIEMRSHVRENIETLDEISDKLNKRYLDKAKDDRYDMWTARGKYKKPKNPAHYTPTGKLKKGVRDRPAAVEYRRRLNQRAKYINKASERATGKKQFSGIGEMTGGGALAGAPGNNTRSGPGMGDDNTLHMKKMRDWKKIWRRHKLPEKK